MADTLTALLANLTGSATFTATGYNAAGASLGSLTLGGTGNSRTLTLASAWPGGVAVPEPDAEAIDWVRTVSFRPDTSPLPRV